MTVREHRDARDRRRGIDRKEVYGSYNAYFPLPNKTKTTSNKTSSPTKVVRNNHDFSTRNYDNLQNMLALQKLFATPTTT